MYKVNLVPILLTVSLLSLAYAIYRSTAERITSVEGGREVVYGEPQHGLILGLCIFAGMCIFSAVALLLSRENNPTPTMTTEKQAFSNRIVS